MSVIVDKKQSHY